MVQMTSSQENFLYDKLLRKIGEDNLEEIKIPNEVLENLKQKNLNQNFEIREYQKRAFQMSIAYFEKYKEREFPSQLLYNMATGSGKTLIMAGLILYLYKKGYNNFLFFVNSNNIIKKTQDNFLNSNHIKYLFNQKVVLSNNKIDFSN